MAFVYHGSKVSGLKEIITHQSTHGNYVYATKDKTIAIIMSKRCGDDATYSFDMNKEGKLDLVERLPHAFDKMYANSFSIYKLDAKYFKDINTGFNEVVSDVNVPVIEEEHYDNLIDAIKKLEEEGLANVYRYPNRPDTIPIDDSDFVDKLRMYKTKLNKDFKDYDLYRWIFLHPNLEKEIRNLAKEYGVDLPYNYEEIKAYFIESQKQRPEHEMFIDNAIEIYNLFNN